MPTSPMTLHEAIVTVLRDCRGQATATKYISEEIARRQLYFQKKGGNAFPDQIFLRARNYPNLFEVIDRNTIKLKDASSIQEEIMIRNHVVSNKYRGTTKYYLVFSELLAAAQYYGTITYQDIAAIMGLPLTGNHMQRQVGHILGEISEDEVQNDRPMLSALAVSVKGHPSPGFFALAEQLGLLQDNSIDGQKKFWAKTKKKLYEVWNI